MPDFEAAFKLAYPLVVLDYARCKVLWDLAVARVGLPGAAAEVGVYKGGSLILLAQACPGRTVHGFDTFQGLPMGYDFEPHKGGEFGDTSLGVVQAALVPYPNVQLRPGYFPATAKHMDSENFAVVHFDGDLYQSCVDAISFFWPRIVPGGVLVFDDYDWPDCPGVKRAVDQSGLRIVAGAPYQCYAIKPGGPLHG